MTASELQKLHLIDHKRQRCILVGIYSRGDNGQDAVILITAVTLISLTQEKI